MTVRLGLVGLGQIARNRHLPAIAATKAFTLAVAGGCWSMAKQSSRGRVVRIRPLMPASPICCGAAAAKLISRRSR